MAGGHRGQRAENAGSSGASSCNTMMVTITAKTESVYAASRCAVYLSSHTRSPEASGQFVQKASPQSPPRCHVRGDSDPPPPPMWPPSAQSLHPAGDCPPDLVRRILLQVMDPRDSHLGLRWQPAGEVEIRA